SIWLQRRFERSFCTFQSGGSLYFCSRCKVSDSWCSGRLTHVLLPPQWSTHWELNIAAIPMDNMHMQGMTLLGFVRTVSPIDCKLLTPTTSDVLFNILVKKPL
ncbi:unnamed protein product, partial [Brassica rapa]